MGLFRSEDMDLYEITIPKDNAWEIMNKLGDIGCMHFINLNKEEQVFSLTFAPFIKRCEETEKRISFIEQE
jgi:V-type H+-transporting ATPase subunit a